MNALPKDSELRFPCCTVVSASAGSGKTHTLTWRFLQLLLSDRVANNSLKNILAITFTNQATAEMRTRLIGNLKGLSLRDEKLLLQATELLEMPEDRIVEKASVVLARILEEYSDLQIRTIDSFMTTVFRTSSFDFGFRPDLDVVLDTRELLTEAFQRLMSQVRGNHELERVLEKLVMLISETRANHQSFLWDPFSKILWEVKRLYSRLAAQENEILSGGGLKRSAAIKTLLWEHAAKFRKTVLDSGFELYKTVDDELLDVINGEADKITQRTVKTEERLIKKPRGGIRQKEFEQLRAALSSPLAEYNRLVEELALCQAQNHYQPYIDAISLVRKILDQLKRERGEIFIDDINKALNPVLKSEGAVDAYIMLGEQICHFLIDEFQDTSPIQWSNLRPLIENSLSQGGSLFVVGDTRQSIYGFRNADWRIMDQLMTANPFPSASRKVIHLKTNWRSGEAILRYTTEVFEKHVGGSDLAGEAKLSGLLEVAQQPIENHRGRGLVESVLFPWDEDLRPEKAEILNLLEDCKRRGFSYGDVAILTPQNDRVIEISSWLNMAGIPVLPLSTLDIRTRKIVGELLALFRFLDTPVDDLSFAGFLLGDLFQANLAEAGISVSRDDLRKLMLDAAWEKPHRRNAYKQLQRIYPDLWKVFFEELYQLAGYLPLYDVIAETLRRFRAFTLKSDEESSLVKFLEMAKSFGDQERNSLKDFLRYADEESDSQAWQVQVPSEVNAVRVMTVHKAKGLEFTIVIAVLYDRDERPSRYFFQEESDGVRLLWIPKSLTDRVPSLRPIYDAQRQEDTVDSLNKLYVALTRAREEMYVLSLEGEREKTPSRFLATGAGQLTLKPTAGKREITWSGAVMPLHLNLPVDYGEPSAEGIGIVQTRRGELVHLVLSRIEYLESNDPPLREFLGDSQFPGIDGDEICHAVSGFLGAPGVRQLFERTPERILFRESEFASPDGSIHRMDRVLVDPGKVEVVDFKTGKGKGKQAYESQMALYVKILRDIYPGRIVSGILAYVDQGRLEQVS